MKPTKEQTLKQSIVSTEVAIDKGRGVSTHIETQIFLPGLISEDGRKVIHTMFVEALAAEFGDYTVRAKSSDPDKIDESALAVNKLIECRKNLIDMFSQAASILYTEEATKYFEGTEEEKTALFREVQALFGMDQD